MPTKTTVSGTVQGPGGDVATSGYVLFRLSPNASSVPFRVEGTTVIAPNEVQATIDSNGEIKAVDGVSDLEIWGNDLITPVNTTYDVVYAPEGEVTQTIHRVLISGATYNMADAVFAPDLNFSTGSELLRGSPIEGNLVPLTTDVLALGAAGRYYAAGYIRELFADNIHLANPVDSDSIALAGYTEAAMPDPAQVGQTARRTDGSRGLWVRGSVDWYPVAGRIYNVEEFGISAALTGAQNSAAWTVLQATITGPSELRFPAGTFEFSAALLNNANVMNIIGAGRDQTVLVFPAGESGLQVPSFGRIAHIALRGPGATSEEVGVAGIESNGSFITIEDVIVEGFRYHGINTGANSSHWFLTEVIIRNNYADGVLFAEGTNNCQLAEPFEIYGNGAIGVDLGGANNCIVGAGKVYSNGANYPSPDNSGCLVQAFAGVAATSNNKFVGTQSYDNQGANFLIRSVATITMENTQLIGVQARGSVTSHGIAIDPAGGTISDTLIDSAITTGNAGVGCYIDGTTSTNRRALVNGLISKDNTGVAGYGLAITGVNALDCAAFGAILNNNAAGNLLYSGAVRLILGPVKLSTATYSGYFGPDVAGGNFWAFRNLDSNVNYIILDVDGHVRIITGQLRVETSLRVGTSGDLAAITKILAVSAVLNFPNTSAQTGSDLTVAVLGAVDQDLVVLGPQASGHPVGNFSAWVSAPDVVTVRYNNYTAVAVNPSSMAFKIGVVHV